MRGMLNGFPDESLEIDYKSFAIVRNPYERFASCIAMFTSGYFGKNIYRRNITVKYILEIVDDSAIVYDKRCKNWFLKWHAMPMTSPEFCMDQVDRIFRFETLHDDWPYIAEFVGIPAPPMPHIGKSKGEVTLSSADRGMIYDHFKADFEVFGYER